MKRLLWIVLLITAAGRLGAQTTVSFNFSAASQPVAGWINVAGDPQTGVRVGTDAASGISISSVATANWAPSDVNAYDGVGAAGGTFFPSGVMLNHWFQFNGPMGVYDPAKPQMVISGLHPDSVYTLRMAGSSTSSSNSNPTEYTVTGLSVSGPIAVYSHNNTANGATFYNIVPAAGGVISVYVNTLPNTDVADICGIQIIAGAAKGTVSGAGQGVSVIGGLLTLGDSASGVGAHAFTSNRYQHLNGHMYSIGGSVNDPVNRPAFRVYDNGDLAAGTTMDTSVNTGGQTGLRYYKKLGLLQVGASDRLDTARIVDTPGSVQGGGILVNSNAHPNVLKGRIYDSYIQGNSHLLDSLSPVTLSIFNGQNDTVRNGPLFEDIISGQGIVIGNTLSNSVITGVRHSVPYPTYYSSISGVGNVADDSVNTSFVAGENNRFGGAYQFVSGVNLINHSPVATTLGSGNVDFSSLPNPHRSTNPPGLANYPLFAIGNSNSATAATRSNAITVLYSGRTQINTNGFSNGLSQTDVTPKAALEVVSTNSGVLLPKLTTVQRNAIVPGDLQNGLLLYNTDSSVFQYYTGSAWTSIGIGGGSASGRWLFNNATQFDTVNNIGIGTSDTRGYKLAVNGNAIFTKIKVKPASAWPDYVFRPGYRLPGLQEVEQFVLTHQHLPGLPSAEEVRKEGQDVGETQVALLKKVEELTLYVIDLDKRVGALQKEHKQLLHTQANHHKPNK
jgi:hypothetical protein